MKTLTSYFVNKGWLNTLLKPSVHNTWDYCPCELSQQFVMIWIFNKENKDDLVEFEMTNLLNVREKLNLGLIF